MIVYDAYQKVVGKPDWAVHVIEDGKSRLVFFGASEDEATLKAMKWVNDNLDTPERRETMRKRALARLEGKAKKKAAETA